jgi:hypothetical protein
MRARKEVELLSRNTNKMQLCNRIISFQSFLKAEHVLSGTPLNIRSSKLYFQPLVYISMWWPAVVKAEWENHSALATTGHHMGIQSRGCKYSLELLMMSGVLLETCWASNKLWSNKFYYKAACCWYFYWVIYDERIHEHQRCRSGWNAIQTVTNVLNAFTFKCVKRFPTSVQVELSDEALSMRMQCKDPLLNLCLLPAKCFCFIRLNVLLSFDRSFRPMIKHRTIFIERCNLFSNERKYFELR